MAFEKCGDQKRKGYLQVKSDHDGWSSLVGHLFYCSFNADMRLDDKDNQVILYPVGALYGRKEEDFVQTELRRLREGLRVESSKLRPPLQLVFFLSQPNTLFNCSSVLQQASQTVSLQRFESVLRHETCRKSDLCGR